MTTLAETIHDHRKSYYEQLARVSQTTEINEWLLWYAQASLQAQERTFAKPWDHQIPKTRLLDRLRGKINER